MYLVLYRELNQMNVLSTSMAALLLVAVALAAGCQRQQDTAAESVSSHSGTSADSAPLVAAHNVSNLAETASDDKSGKDAAKDAAKGAVSHGAPQPGRPRTVSEALAVLMEGNQRFVDGKSIHPHESSDYRASLSHEQHPFATVLACSDSRVTPVLIFDQGIGDLFVIRVAGNVFDDDVTGSMEYAFDHLGAKLLIILGHEDCGAVTAAYHAFVAKDLKQREPHEIESLLMRIEPALHEIDRSKTVAQQIAEGVEANVRRVLQELLRIPDVQKAQGKGQLKIIGAVYSVRTGVVRLLDM